MPEKNQPDWKQPSLDEHYNRAWKLWLDFANQISEDVTTIMKEGMNRQMELYNEQLSALKDTRTKVGKESVMKTEELQRQWAGFSETVGQRIRHSLVESWNEQKKAFENLMELSKKTDISAVQQSMMKYWTDVATVLSDTTAQFGRGEKGPPAVSAVSKQLADMWFEAAAKILHTYLKSPLFAQTIGKAAESTLDLRQQLNEANMQYLHALGFPTRREMDDIHKKLLELSRKLDAQMNELRKLDVPSKQPEASGFPSENRASVAHRRRKKK
jgi:hypothetical protein